MNAITRESRAAKAARLRKLQQARLATGRMLVVPGAHDPINAMLVERAGFEAAYVGSYATAASLFGYADTGLLGMSESVAHAAAIAAAIDIPLLADAEDGWGNAANIWRTVRASEDAGIAGIHIEDYIFGRHTAAPAKIADLDEALGKIRAALDARTDPRFVICAHRHSLGDRRSGRMCSQTERLHRRRR